MQNSNWNEMEILKPKLNRKSFEISMPFFLKKTEPVIKSKQIHIRFF